MARQIVSASSLSDSDPTTARIRSKKKGGGRQINNQGRTERGIVVPPDIALCAAHEHRRRCIVPFFAAAIEEGRAVDVYALEGISVLRVRTFAFAFQNGVRADGRWDGICFFTVPFRGSLVGRRSGLGPRRRGGRRAYLGMHGLLRRAPG